VKPSEITLYFIVPTQNSGQCRTGQLYSPYLTDIAAYRKMKKWISLCPGLLQRLYDLGYESKRRSFTPLEVRVIVDALGEP